MSPRRRRHFFAALALMLVGGLAEVLTIGAVFPFLLLVTDPAGAGAHAWVRGFRDLVGLAPSADLLPWAAGALIIAAIVAGAVRLALLWVSQSFIFRLGHEMGSEIYARTLRQPYREHVRRNSSDVLAAIEKVQIVIFSVMLPLMQGVVGAFTAMVIIAVLVAIDPATALIATATMSVVYLGVTWLTRDVLRNNSRIINSLHTERLKQAQEGLGGIRDIILDHSQPVFDRQFRTLDDRLRRAQAVNVFVAGGPRFVVETAGIILIVLLAYWLSGSPRGIAAAIPVLGALALGAQRLLPLLQQVYAGWSTFWGSADVLLEIFRLLGARQITTAPLPAGVAPRHFEREIRFADVDFRYDGAARNALSGIDLTIRRGERIGVLGTTGSGKSTLIDILMGLLDPTSGEVLIDGSPLDDSTRANWQAQIGHVPQSIYLSDNSIAMNIAFGVPEAQIDRARLLRAAEQAQIHTFVETLPDGYETRVGERGVRLSGGQRQRIGIARALYKDASVLVFDEATSALDNETEAAVMSAVRGLAENLTVVIIAHRLSTLEDCDRIVSIERGRIAGVGDYRQMVAGR